MTRRAPRRAASTPRAEHARSMPSAKTVAATSSGRRDGFAATARNAPGPVPGDDAATAAGDQAPAALPSRPRRLCRRRARAQSAPGARRSRKSDGRRTAADPDGRGSDDRPRPGSPRTSIRAARRSSGTSTPASTTSFRTRCPVPRAAGGRRRATSRRSRRRRGRGSGGGGFDDDGPDFEATLTSETSLAEHLEAPARSRHRRSRGER